MALCKLDLLPTCLAPLRQNLSRNNLLPPAQQKRSLWSPLRLEFARKKTPETRQETVQPASLCWADDTDGLEGPEPASQPEENPPTRQHSILEELLKTVSEQAAVIQQLQQQLQTLGTELKQLKSASEQSSKGQQRAQRATRRQQPRPSSPMEVETPLGEAPTPTPRAAMAGDDSEKPVRASFAEVAARFPAEDQQSIQTVLKRLNERPKQLRPSPQIAEMIHLKLPFRGPLGELRQLFSKLGIQTSKVLEISYPNRTTIECLVLRSYSDSIPPMPAPGRH